MHSIKVYLGLLLLILFQVEISVAFALPAPKLSAKQNALLNASRKDVIECGSSIKQCNNDVDRSLSRRIMIGTIVTAVSAPLLTQVQPSIAQDLLIPQSQVGDIQCLLDLPPTAKGCVRLFLCRHGQTENNRLRLVQGARVDPPLNETGRRQAIRLGETLSTLKLNGSLSADFDFPRSITHSSLQRARETATIASLMIGKGDIEDEDNLSYVNEIFSRDSPISMDEFKEMLELRQMSSLGEVDFGAVEGKSVNEAKAEMMKTYAQWALGAVDVRNGDDGETGRSVLTRASLALNSLTDIAASNGGSAIAVTHSTYLRMLLSIALDCPLAEAATFEQRNCCINVLDVDMKKKKQLDKNLFGGKLSLAPKDFKLTIPRTKVVRMNEIRHLDGLL